MGRNFYLGYEVGSKRDCVDTAIKKRLGEASTRQIASEEGERPRFLFLSLSNFVFVNEFLFFLKDHSVWRKSNKLKRFLSEKLAEFLDSKFLYRLRRITSLEKKQIYVGASENSEDFSQSKGI